MAIILGVIGQKVLDSFRLNLLSGLFLLSIIYYPCQQVAAGDEYDCIIVGGGIAGLAAAIEMQGKKTLLIEKETRLGGRAYSAKALGEVIDLGAVYLPLDSGIPGIDEVPFKAVSNTQVGIFYNDKIYYGETPNDAVFSLPLEDGVKTKLNLFKSYKINLDKLNLKTRTLLDDLNRFYFPASIDRYSESLQRDLFRQKPSSHFRFGSESFIQILRNEIKTPILLGSTVDKIVKEKSNYKVVLSTGKVLLSRSVILATPAPISYHLLRGNTLQAAEFLKKIQYGAYLIFAFISKKKIDLAQYILFQHSFFSAMHFTQGESKNYTKIIFSVRDNFMKTARLSESELIDRAKLELLKLPFGITDKNAYHFVEVKNWPYANPVKTGDYSSIVAGKSKLAPGLVLAGDYLNPENPYGISSAYTSGKNAALSIKQGLSTGVDVKGQ